MKKNVGTADQFIRFLIAFTAIILYFADCISGTLTIAVFCIAALTALLNYCPLYGVLKFNTLKKLRNPKSN